MSEQAHDRFPFSATPKLGGPWGVWDRRHDTWAEPAEHSKGAAEHLAVVLNEAYAAGFADAMIVKAHGRARLRRFL